MSHHIRLSAWSATNEQIDMKKIKLWSTMIFNDNVVYIIGIRFVQYQDLKAVFWLRV